MRHVLLPLLLVACAPSGHHWDGPLWDPDPLPDCEPVAGGEVGAVFCGEETRAVLDNPHQGWEEFSGVANANSPPMRVAYERYWWDELEPTPGDIQFSTIDAAIEAADAKGQTFAFRVMPVPETTASYDDEAFLAAVEATVAALGARYDGDPRIEQVDVGFIGEAGEWADTPSGVAYPSLESATRIFDSFAAAFPSTPVLQNVGSTEAGGEAYLRLALDRGFGWRADCWGDLRENWNHQDDFYDERLEAAAALDVWQTAPVAVETCGDMVLWQWSSYEEDQVRWLLHWLLDRHVLLVNNKSRDVPEAWRDSVDEYLGFAGPRYVVARAERTATGVSVEVVNRGSTPAYRPWRIGMRVREGGEAVGEVVVSAEELSAVTDAVTLELPLPDPATTAALDLALLDESGAVVSLANADLRDDGYLEVFP
jgi:hypothetical protein